MSKINTNNASTDIRIREIVELAHLLRDSGDKVLSASSKLSLSTALLNDLNVAFSVVVNETDDIESSFQVCHSSRNDVFRDVKFLHDFVQKTVSLKIKSSADEQKTCVDITKFRCLRYLELQKVGVDSIKGIQGIRGQLECIVCSGGRGVGQISNLLAACGGDAGVAFVWTSLCQLSLPYNALTRLDDSLEYVPWLHTIDLSHNLIEQANELEFLPNLKYVNLGYNKLEAVPTFHRSALQKLRKLILKNNYLENINGVHALECLTELDLSFNCLTDHVVLWPLETMLAVVWISLEGNPLSYHPRHRLHSIKHLHPALSNTKFVLDNLPLNKAEKLYVSENRVFSMRSMRCRSRDDLTSLSCSLNSDRLSVSIDNSVYSDIMTKSESLDLLESVDSSNTTKTKRKRNVREAIIDEEDHEKEKAKLSSLSSSYLEPSVDHLETKRQILELRAKFGEDNWLSSHAGTFVQNIMGIKKPIETSHTSISPMFSDELTENEVADKNNAGEELMESSDIEKIEEQPESTPREESIDIRTDTKETFKSSIETVYDPEEEVGDLYLVQKKKLGSNEMEDVFLILTPEDVKEKDYMTGKTKFCWASNTIVSCVLGRGTPTTVDIIFDTTRKDRNSRTYLVNLDDAKRIVQTLNDSVTSQLIVLKVFKCMKCSTHFSQDDDYSITSSMALSGSAPLRCPTCKSTLVIQTDELSSPMAEKVMDKKPEQHIVEAIIENPLQHSESHSSIGRIEGGVKFITSPVHSDSHSQAQNCCSATSLEESRESTPSTSTLARKYESDIEILSNPSQSSIEVLDDGSRSNSTPSRKRSSEERRIAAVPSLLTIPDTAQVMAGLTESSSSGSLTDSVCTAYENKAAKLMDNGEMSISKHLSETEKIKEETTEKETGYTAATTNLSSMLGGLLQSMKIGTSKDVTSKPEEVLEFVQSNIQYSYKDFSSVDHRIKLHIILNVFEHEHEELALLLRAEILTQNSPDPFPGCLILSTAKVYILRISGPEGEDPQRWLHKDSSWTIDRLRSFTPLPFKQGVAVELQQPSKLGDKSSNTTVLCILQDFQRTTNFLFYLTDSPMPASCEVECSVPQHCNELIKNVLKLSKYHKDGDAVRLLAFFSSAVFKSSNQTTKLKLSGLIVTSSAMIVIDDKLQWLLPENDQIPEIVTEQGMSNLIEVDFVGTSLNLNFLDEVAGVEVNWILEFVSAIAADAVIDSIRPPWEELFSVPLQINSPPVESSEKI